MAERTIWLRAEAPPMPATGDPCNGCGTCCASEPCPLGAVLSLRTRGRCRWLRFDEPGSRYRCGLMPGAAQPTAGFRAWPRQALQGLVQRLVMRWIGAGLGCDTTAQTIAVRH